MLSKRGWGFWTGSPKTLLAKHFHMKWGGPPTYGRKYVPCYQLFKLEHDHHLIDPFSMLQVWEYIWNFVYVCKIQHLESTPTSSSKSSLFYSSQSQCSSWMDEGQQQHDELSSMPFTLKSGTFCNPTRKKLGHIHLNDFFKYEYDLDLKQPLTPPQCKIIVT